MARTIKEENFATRRNEIMDAAQKFIYLRGYDSMSINDLLDDLRISKGAFYHYFDSKQGLLEALLDRMTEQAVGFLLPIVRDPRLTALEKYNRFFDSAMQWKTAQKELFLALLATWYADSNAIVRQKLTTRTLEHMEPLLGAIIRQGVREGIFHTPFPEGDSQVVLSLFLGFGETVASHMLSGEPGSIVYPKIVESSETYTRAIERVLDAPSGSLSLLEPEIIKVWTDLLDKTARQESRYR